MRQEDITYQEKLDELRLDMSHPNSRSHIFVLLEGLSDVKVFRKLFPEHCKVEYMPGGKLKLEEGITTLLNIHSLIIGIRDADFLHLSTLPYNPPNIFLTDYHDTEMTILAQTDILSALLFEYTDLAKEKHLEFRNQVLQTIEKLSYLKWLDNTESLNLTFKNVGFEHLIDVDQHEIDFTRYLQNVLSKSGNEALIKDKDIILELLREFKEEQSENEVDLLQLTSGHDLLKAFAKYFREKYPKKGLSEQILASTIRIAFNQEQFKQTSLFRQLVIWAEDNEVSIW